MVLGQRRKKITFDMFCMDGYADDKFSFTNPRPFSIIHIIQQTKRIDEESTPIKALQRASPRGTVAERDGAGDMWKMASEQRTEPGQTG